MNDIRDELFMVRGERVLRCFDAVMEDVIEKSASTQVSEYFIHVTTIANGKRYNRHTFAMNECEASFDMDTDELLSLTLRDTSVNKKLTFNHDKAVLSLVRGGDDMGEVKKTDIKERVYSININGSEYAMYPEVHDLYELYENITGIPLSLETSEETQERENSNWWSMFKDLTATNGVS